MKSYLIIKIIQESDNLSFWVGIFVPIVAAILGILGIMYTANTAYKAALEQTSKEFASRKKQSAREFIAKERADWLKETRIRFSRFIELLSIILNKWESENRKVEGRINYIQSKSNNSDISLKDLNIKIDDELRDLVDEHYSKLIECGNYLSFLFNPEDNHIIDKISEITLYTKSFINSENVDDRQEAYNEIANTLDFLIGHMRSYFKIEWEKIKEDIDYNSLNDLSQ